MKAKFITLGCKTNQYESNAMEQSFKKDGIEILPIDSDEAADICVVNTCSVTNVAERKSRQMLRREKQQNPDAIVIACGCYVQVAQKEVEAMPEVDIVIGINEKNHLLEIVKEYIANRNEKSRVSDVMHKQGFEDFGTTTYTELNRAVIKIQDGCDRFCTYCIIPYARGKVRSRNPHSILTEIEEIAKTGIKEVVLTGIHIASYGKDFSKEEGEQYRKEFGYSADYSEFDPREDLTSGAFRLIDLVEQMNKIDSIERIRLGSIEPKWITEEVIDRLAKCEKVCDHFHLSLQSGCDETLERMKRRYTTEDFRKSVTLLRKAFPKVALTTDIIVGFPGETDEEFEKTYEFLSEIKFYKMHVFKYSPRRGTIAENLPNQVDGNIKEERSRRLIELSDNNENGYNQELIGKSVNVLFEEREGKYFKGHTTNYVLVKVETKENLENQILPVEIIESKNLETIGKI
jgi:threonylcarbamoyladenosine tRNA methylthiotransferase MtaB